MGLTSEQSAIVRDRGRDLLVTAGAGSGKTRVLVERYVSLLGDHRIRELAAVTFTDAAATEMRERVRREVLARPELADHRAELDDAVIGTIHSLCRRILRERPVEAAIDPAVRVLPDDEAEFEIITACVDALEEAADANDHRALAIREIGVFGLTNHLPLMVARRDEVEAAYRALPGNTPESWAPHVQALLDAGARDAVEKARPELVEWVSWLQGAHAGDEDALSRTLDDVLAAIGNPAEGDWDDLLERALDAGPRVKLTGGSARNWAYDLKAVKDTMRRFRDTADRLRSTPHWNEHDETALYVLASLRDLFEDACSRYAARKRALAALDYLDLELEAARMLRSHPEVAAAYRSRFRYLMVDELQDTNPSQIAVLDLLSRGGGADSPGPERFFVGDVKQAIYRFRGSDVRSFTRLHREVESTGTIRALSQSFRAHDSLVAVLNVLFGAVFGQPKEDFEAPMQAMTGRGPDAPPAPHLTLMPVSTRSPDGGRPSDHERRRVEADAVAAEIASLLERGDAVWDTETRCRRPARPSDVAILLRRLTNVHIFEGALESHLIPYRTPAGAGFFTRQEVLDLTNLLGWLVEPDDEIALVGALRSPLFMIDDQSLLALRSGRRRLIDALREPPEGVSVETRAFCARATEVLDDLRSKAPFAAPAALLERALDLTGYEAVWAPLQGGDQALANVRKFVGIARTLSDHSLDELVTYVRRRRDELAAREGLAVLDDSDAVRLMTVHGAKGLEFPIVFVPEGHLRSRESYDQVRWREEGIAPTLKQDVGSGGNRLRPGFYAYLLQRDQVEEAAEHKRLFYVAATRAADTLYVSGDEASSGDGWLTSAVDAFGTGAPGGVEIRPTLPVDLRGIARRPAPSPVAAPPEDAEEGIMPTLVARPRVIPLRSSTPVTALRAPKPTHSFGRHGDGLGLVRGSLAHLAIEVWFTTGERPSLVDLARTLDADVGEMATAQLAAEVDAMLDLLDASPLAATLRDPSTRAHFELPFSWDWDGVPVHGTIDLAYEAGGVWRVVDFKTDEVRGGLAETADPYLPQLALYASALERATGQRPEASLLFLRDCRTYTPPPMDLYGALVTTRERIDAGQMLEIQPSPGLGDAPEDRPGL